MVRLPQSCLRAPAARPPRRDLFALRSGRDIGHGFFFALLHAAWDCGETSRARGAWTQIVLQSADPTATRKQMRVLDRVA